MSINNPGNNPNHNQSEPETLKCKPSCSLKSFLAQITIEPLAFLAILALYVEFPSIQDLIYTKICLQSIPSNHSHGNELYTPSPTSTTHSPPPPTEHVICDRLNKSSIPAHIRQEILNGDTVFWLKYQVTICTLCALSSPYWGGISDKIGRLVPMNVPIVAAALSNLISLIFGLLISLNSHRSFHINWLYLGAVLNGLSGGQAIIIMNVFSFISDNTSSESRSKRVTVLESVIYLSHSVGFLINKYIMSLGLASAERPWLNRHFVAFLVCFLLNVSCVMYTIVKLRHCKFHKFLNNFEREQQEAAMAIDDVLNNSLSTSSASITRSGQDKRNPGDAIATGGAERFRELTSSTPDDLDDSGRCTKWTTVLTFTYYKETYLTATKRRDSRSIILLLLLCGFISALGLTTLMSLFYIYLKMEPFNWSTSQYSHWSSITSITKGLALVALTLCMKFLPGWNVPDPLVASIGFMSKFVGLLMIGLAQSSTPLYWALLAFVLSEYSMPPIRSLLSKLVVKDELGKIYSCLASLQSLCFLMGNIVFYVAYTTIERQDFFRLCFIVVAAIEFGAVIIMLTIYATLSRIVVV